MPKVSITIPDKNPQPYRFNLDHKKVTIGRSKDSDIVIDEPSVSGLHATMERVEGGYILRDRGSTNGISLDDTLMDIIDLRNGDDVKVGDSAFDYLLTEEELDILDEEEFTPHEKEKTTDSKDKKNSKEDDDKGDDEDEDAPPKLVKKKLAVAKKSSASNLPPPTIAPIQTSGEGIGFLAGAAAFILGFMFFFMGVSSSYVKAEKKKGREEVSLLKDIKEGKPAPANQSPENGN